MDKNIKYLIENTINFDITAYADEDNISQEQIHNILYTIKPKDRYELEQIIIKRLKENPMEPQLLDIDTSNIDDMFHLFSAEEPENNDETNYLLDADIRVSWITKLDLSTWNTSKVKTMGDMFYGLECLEELDISGFDTSNVEDMSYMFYSCGADEIDVSGFDTSKVKWMDGMFGECYMLKNIDLSNFNTSNVKDMSGMFVGCRLLESLHLSNFDTSQVKNISNMFKECESLTELDLSNFNTLNVEQMQYTFYNCKKLKKLNLSGWNTINLKDMRKAFYNCFELKVLDVSHFNVENTRLYEFIFKCHPDLKLPDWLPDWQKERYPSNEQYFN